MHRMHCDTCSKKKISVWFFFFIIFQLWMLCAVRRLLLGCLLFYLTATCWQTELQYTYANTIPLMLYNICVCFCGPCAIDKHQIHLFLMLSSIQGWIKKNVFIFRENLKDKYYRLNLSHLIGSVAVILISLWSLHFFLNCFFSWLF